MSSDKPADFFIGLVDFFAVLLPGAILTYLVLPWSAGLFPDFLPPLTEPGAGWIAFGVASYLVGHVLHHLGGFVDKWLYDKLYVARWKRRKGEEPRLIRARKLMGIALGEVVEADSVFSWASSCVRLWNAAGAVELDRAGVDSKFFRSLVFVALVAGIIAGVKGQLWLLGSAVTLMGFSLWRYCDRRWKAAQLTYEYFVILGARPAEQK